MSADTKTAKQIPATPKTAKQKRGPKTRHGKALVSQNAIKHGIFSRKVPPHEERAFRKFHAGHLASLAPMGALESSLAERIILTHWRLGRLERWEAILLAEQNVYHGEPNASWGCYAKTLLLPNDDLQKIQRYEAHLERVFHKALHELEALQEKRRGGAAPLARLEVHGDALGPAADLPVPVRAPDV